MFYVVLQSSAVQTKLTSWITKKIEHDTGIHVSVSKVNISFFNQVIFDDVYLSDQKNDTLVYVNKLIASVDSFSIKKEHVHLSKIVLGNPTINISRGLDSLFNYSFLIPEADTTKNKPFNWEFSCRSLEVLSGKISYLDSIETNEQLSSITASNLNFKVDEILFKSVKDFGFNIDYFGFDTNRKIDIAEMAGMVRYSDSTILVTDLMGLAMNSNFHFPIINLGFREYLKSRDLDDLVFDINMEQLNLLVEDLNFLVPELDEFDLRALFYGNFRGTLGSFSGTDVKIKIGNLTNLSGQFIIDGLPDIENTYISIDVDESYANLNEYRKLEVPEGLVSYLPPLPDFFENLGTFRYTGNFTGFLNDYAITGGIYTNLGNLVADGFLKPNEDKTFNLSGHLSTTEFELGTLFKNPNLGIISFNGELDGVIENDSSYTLAVDGVINDIYFNDYQLSNINLDGRIKPKEYNGIMSINDPNLKLSYFGSLNLAVDQPSFSFVADIGNINLSNLNLIQQDSIEISAYVDANFIGKNIDLMKGEIAIENFTFQNKLDSIHLDQLNLINSGSDDSSKIEIYSDWFDGEIFGRYYFMDIYYSALNLFEYYLPSALKNKPKEIDDINNFSFDINVKDISEVLKVINPKFSIEEQFNISGNYHPAEHDAYMEASIPLIRYENKGIEGMRLRLYAEDEEFYVRLNADKIHLSDPINVYNFTNEVYGSNNRLDLNLFWHNNETSTFSGTLRTSTHFSRTPKGNSHVEMDIASSKLFVSDTLWNVSESRIVIDTTSIAIHDFKIFNNTQQLYVNGVISEEKSDELTTIIDNVNLNLFKPLLGKVNLAGEINGQASIKDAYNERQLNMNILVDSLQYNNGYLGDLKLGSRWNNEEKYLSTNLSLSSGVDTLLLASGIIDPINAVTDLDAVATRTPVSILGILMPPTFNEQTGFVNGSVKISGKPNHLQLNGVLKPETEASLGLSYLNSVYYFSDPVYFKGDTLLFDQINFRDKDGNRGVFDGTIAHQNFRNMVFDMNMKTNRILGLNTTAADNDQFYGKAYASGHLEITGTSKNVEMTGRIRTEKGSTIFIPFESEENAKISDFIVFVKQGSKEEKEIVYDVATNGVDMNFDVEVTPDAEIQLIFNSQMGDIIKARGVGDLNVQIDRNYKIEMYGDFTVDKGEYLFTLESIINKLFTIEKGGTIQWSGDPYDAMLDLTAVYKVKTTLKKLFVENTGGDIDVSRIIPVDCIIYLEESLTQPAISFDIFLPTVDETVRNQVDMLIATEEEVNKQMISLLMLGNFYTSEVLTGARTTSTTSAMLGSTAGELISNQLSNWLSQISDSWNFGVNWRPGDELTNDQLELALSTQIFNDRVTIDGNIANSANSEYAQQASNTSGFVGDFDINVKLTDNGKLQLKAYTHSNDDLNDDTATNTQGVGFTYREDFNSFKELWLRFKNLFKGKKDES